MLSRLPRWLLITLIAILAAIIITGLTFMSLSPIDWVRWTGLILSGILIAVILAFALVSGPQLYKLYKFQKHFKSRESQLRQLPTLMQTGKTQEAMARFDAIMKDAPDNAYLLYMHAFFLQAGGKLPEAMAAANKALKMVDRDPFLQAMLQQAGGQMGQPTTVAEFKEQLLQLKDSLEPRVNQMRERHQKAISKRKKKSR